MQNVNEPFHYDDPRPHSADQPLEIAPPEPLEDDGWDDEAALPHSVTPRDTTPPSPMRSSLSTVLFATMMGLVAIGVAVTLLVIF